MNSYKIVSNEMHESKKQIDSLGHPSATIGSDKYFSLALSVCPCVSSKTFQNQGLWCRSSGSLMTLVLLIHESSPQLQVVSVRPSVQPFQNLEKLNIK